MGKFDKYEQGKMRFNVRGEDFELDFKVEDRIAIARIYDHKDMETRYKVLIECASNLIKRNYPGESQAGIEAFVAKNIDEFYAQLMIAAGLATQKDMDEMKETLKKEKLQ
jgi:hypothetical protein